MRRDLYDSLENLVSRISRTFFGIGVSCRRCSCFVSCHLEKGVWRYFWVLEFRLRFILGIKMYCIDNLIYVRSCFLTGSLIPGFRDLFAGTVAKGGRFP